MSREVHVRFCESRGVRLPPATHPILIVQGTVSRGQQGARQLITQLRRDLPHPSWELGSVVADNVLYMTWRAQSTTGNANGTDTFVFHDGKIRVQTVVVTTGSSS